MKQLNNNLLALCLGILLMPLLGTQPLVAQNILANVQKYSVENGLSHREIFAVHQDKEGYIWIGTKYGLNRFDGQFFKTWTKEKQGLVTNEIHHILEDSKGWLWLFTGDNWFHNRYPTYCSLVNTFTGEVKTLEEKFGDELPFKISELVHQMVDTSGVLFFTTENKQVYSYDATDGFRLISTALNHRFYPHLIAQSQGKEVLWGYTGEKEVLKAFDLVAMDLDGNILQKHRLPEGIEYVHFLGENEEGLHYVLYDNVKELMLFTLDKSGKIKSRDFLSFSSDIISTQEIGDWSRRMVYQSDKDFFWFKSHPDFFIFNLKKGVLFNFEDDYQALINADIHNLFFDKNDFAWLSTAEGLFKIELIGNPFKRLLFQNKEAYKITEAHSCRGILVEEAQVWVNTYKGRRLFKNLNSSPTRLPYLSNPKQDEKNLYLLWNPLAIYKDKFEEAIWFSENILVKRDLDTGKEQTYFWENSNILSTSIWSIFQDKKGQVWLGTDDGIGKLDTTKNQLEFDENLQKRLNSSTIHSFVERQNGTVWIGSTTGLYLWLPEKGIIDRYWTGGEGIYRLPHDNILHIHEDKKGILWLASGGGGLIQLGVDNRQSTDFQQFTTENGLSNNNLYAIYEDDFENLWMSSDYGIIRFNKNTHRAKAFLPEDGITHSEFNRISHFQDDSGRIYFGGLNGITVFEPSYFQEEHVLQAPVKITDFQQMDGATDVLINKTNELLKSGKIILQPNDRFFRLQFAMLDYRSPELIRFAWKIEGWEEGWHHINENFIRVIGLPYGEYLLKIKSQAATGEWSQSELHIPINVLAPFYLKPWVIVLSIIAFLSALFIWYKWRTRQLKIREANLIKLVQIRTQTISQQAEELKQLDKVKSRFFANVSHELRTPLTLILGPIGTVLKSKILVQKHTKLLRLAQHNGTALLQLINELLDLSKLESSKLELEEEPTILYLFAHQIVSAFESLAESKKIDFLFQYEAHSDLQVFLDKDKFQKIVNNLLSNAFKFTPKKGKISVQLIDQNSCLLLKVKDSGRGISPEDLPKVFDRFFQTQMPNQVVKGGTGIGLALCKEFSNLFKGKIWVESTLGKGSTFHFEFPKKEILKSLTTEAALELETLKKDRNILVEAREDLETEFADGAKETGLNTTTLISTLKHKTKILIVEDNHSLRAYLKMILEEFYEVYTAENGKEALNILAPKISNGKKETLNLELIISDVMMPIMDGFQLLEQLKASDEWWHIPVVMLTARAGLADKLKALRIGVDDYLTKPFEEEELLVRIANLLKNYKKRKIESQLVMPDLERKDKEINNAFFLSKEDQNWLQQLESVTLNHLHDSIFNVEQLAKLLFISRRQLQRRILTLTGLSPNSYIQEARLHKAKALLEKRTESSVKAVAFQVGIRSVKYFSRTYKKRFGKLPSSYL